MANIAFCKECSSSFLTALVSNFKEAVFQPGDVLIQEGDIGTCMYLLNIGTVDVKVGENHVATLKEGSLFGEMAVISSETVAAKRTASIIAKTTCVCWCIDRPSLLKVMAAFPKERAVITSYAEQRLKDLISKGLVPDKRSERLWLRQQIQETVSSKGDKEQVVEFAKLKFLKSLKKSRVVPEEGLAQTGAQNSQENHEAEEGSEESRSKSKSSQSAESRSKSKSSQSVESDAQSRRENPRAHCSFLKARYRRSWSNRCPGEVPQESEAKSTCKYSGIVPMYLSSDSTIDEEPRETSQSEPPAKACQMQEQGDESLRTTRSQLPYANSQMENMLEIIFPEGGKSSHTWEDLRKLSVKSSVPNEFVLPPVMPLLKRRSQWSSCETVDASKAHTRALNFLAKRGVLA